MKYQDYYKINQIMMEKMRKDWEIIQNALWKTEKENRCRKCGEIVKGDEEETLCANCAL